MVDVLTGPVSAEPAEMVGVAADVDGIGGRGANGQPLEFVGGSQLGPPPHLATEQVRVRPVRPRQQDARGQIGPAALDRRHQQLQLILLQALEQVRAHAHFSFTPRFIVGPLSPDSGAHQTSSQAVPFASKHQH